MTQLCELARKYGTDKVDHHEYTVVYDYFLHDKRDTVRKVLEIGIGTTECMRPGYKPGASLYMWRDYFPNARVFGFDIDSRVLISDLRIDSFRVDQGNEASLLNGALSTGGDLDLIVDDGSHLWEHQLLSAQVLAPFLNRDGIYIIEDIHVPSEQITRRISSSFRTEVVECPGRLVCECGCGGPEKLVVIRRG